MIAATPPRTMLAGAFVVAFVALQALVPAVMLFAERPAPFAWQMYSALATTPRAWVIDTAGTETEVDLSTLFARHRAELDYETILVRGLCARDGITSVRIQSPTGDQPQLIACPD